MSTPLDPRYSRGLALALLLAVIGLGYLLFVHWSYVVPLIEARSAFLEERAQEQRMRANAAQRPEIEARLAEVRAFEAGNPGFLSEATFDLAAPALIMRIQNLVERQGQPERCLVINSQPMRGTANEAFERVTVQVRLRCELEHLYPILHDLESGSPQLFLSELNIVARRTPSQPGGEVFVGYVDVSFNVHGYLRAQARGGA
jgi:general secretion pathway protein M